MTKLNWNLSSLCIFMHNWIIKANKVEWPLGLADLWRLILHLCASSVRVWVQPEYCTSIDWKSKTDCLDLWSVVFLKIRYPYPKNCHGVILFPMKLWCITCPFFQARAWPLQERRCLSFASAGGDGMLDARRTWTYIILVKQESHPNIKIY